jgi:hypothetical protein
MNRLPTLAALLLLAVPARAQADLAAAPVLPCVLHAHAGADHSADAHLADAHAEALRSAGPAVTTRVTGSATFVVTYTGFTPAAQAAFQLAVDRWADLVTSTVPIRIEATFASLNTGVLGSAGPRLIRNFVGAPVSGTFYPYALADSRAGQDLDPNASDIQATFNSTFGSFYFGLDGNPPANQFDFASVVLHEIGHGLGFVGSGRVDDGQSPTECNGSSGIGCWGFFTQGTAAQFFGSMIYDRFVEDQGGAALLTSPLYPNTSAALGTLLRSNALFADGAETTAANGGERPRLQAPTTFGNGSSYSHWNEGSFLRDTPNALMTPFIEPGEAYENPGPVTCALFEDMGWALGTACQNLVAVDTPPAGAPPLVTLVGPNPFAAETHVRVASGATPGEAALTLYDTIGRTVWSTTAPLAADARVRIDGGALPAGVYLLHVRTPDGAATLPLRRVR